MMENDAPRRNRPTPDAKGGRRRALLGKAARRLDPGAMGEALRRLRALLPVKLEDEDTGAIHHTSVACKLLDQGSCRCGDYAGRKKIVPDCVRLTLKKLSEIKWLPPTCAYRLRFEGKSLPSWHPLLSGDPDSVHRAGVSVQGRVEAGEDEVDTDDLPDFIRLWPKRWPKRAR